MVPYWRCCEKWPPAIASRSFMVGERKLYNMTMNWFHNRNFSSDYDQNICPYKLRLLKSDYGKVLMCGCFATTNIRSSPRRAPRWSQISRMILAIAPGSTRHIKVRALMFEWLRPWATRIFSLNHYWASWGKSCLTCTYLGSICLKMLLFSSQASFTRWGLLLYLNKDWSTEINQVEHAHLLRWISILSTYMLIHTYLLFAIHTSHDLQPLVFSSLQNLWQ